MPLEIPNPYPAPIVEKLSDGSPGLASLTFLLRPSTIELQSKVQPPPEVQKRVHEVPGLPLLQSRGGKIFIRTEDVESSVQKNYDLVKAALASDPENISIRDYLEQLRTLGIHLPGQHARIQVAVLVTDRVMTIPGTERTVESSVSLLPTKYGKFPVIAISNSAAQDPVKFFRAVVHQAIHARNGAFFSPGVRNESEVMVEVERNVRSAGLALMQNSSAQLRQFGTQLFASLGR